MSTFVTPTFLPPTPLDIRIAFFSTYPPKRCGIGTYTKDLATAINNLNPERLAEIIALDDQTSESLDYPWEVSRRVRKDVWEDYEQALDYLNNSVIDIVSIQHEYGIFGGWDGDYCVKFAQQLTKPYIITFHTVLQNPSESQKKVLQDLAAGAQAVIVMLSTAADILRDVYAINPAKVVPIHHGAPDFPFEQSSAIKKSLGLENRLVMSSVNLISEGKGIEYAIEALPEVVKKYPHFLYLVVGQTHPVVLERDGEVYREKLQALVKKFGLEKNVQFINKYVTLEELIDYVRASDFYITPYEGMEQISSGSLAYAIAAGKLCISTAYRYAQEILAGGRGYLVPPREAGAITRALLEALDAPEQAQRMREKCYAEGRKMTWARVGFRHVRIMDHLLSLGRTEPRFTVPTLAYLHAMTDERGLLEHSNGDAKNHTEGYATDDNARGLIVALQYGDKKLARQYLNFLVKAESGGKLYCDMDESGQWQGQPGTGDWFGRAFWAATYAMRYGFTLSMRKQATELVRRLLPTCTEVRFLRTWSYILLGLAILQDYEWDELHLEREALLAQGLEAMQQAYAQESTSSWRWLEDKLHYDNPRIAHALLEVARAFDHQEAKTLGLTLLDFVLDQTFDVRGNHFRFVGNKGWQVRGKERALFDEQPIEAGVTTQACYSAFRVTGISYYRDMLNKAFAWYHGDNILRRPLFNPARMSVYDGIMAAGLNPNQGAESILEYLLGYTCYAKLVQEGQSSDSTHPTQSIRTAA